MNLNYTWCYVRSVDPLSSIPKISKKKLTAILRGPRQAPLSVEFSRQEYWSGLPCPSPDLPDPGIEPRSPVLRPVSRTAGGFLTDWATYAFFPVISERGLCGSLRVWRIYLCRPSSVSAELSWSFWIKRSLTLGQCWQGPHTIPSSFHFSGLPHSNKDCSGQFLILPPPPSGEGQLFFDPLGREATPQSVS